MSDELWKAYAHGWSAAMGEGGVFLPNVLLRTAGSLGLTDSDVLLMLQLMSYAQAEYTDFPTMEQLAERMGTTPRTVGERISRLIKGGFLSIDDYVDGSSGMQSERYNWSGWFMKAAEQAAEERREAKRSERQAPSEARARKPASDLFSVFEQEFGRLLSPMECETISAWIDQDRYTEEIILFALKEAVFAGKLSLRYIDRILIEWARNRVTNADEARAHSEKFYGGRA
ncbi:DnaD domain protein [Paenibacillus sp. LHD-117]|uniref:DnaD domain protein n=1 Tax=Paenibacillus sp. LHD-117 TaxID=3071412 RepID=UPI0027E0FDEB|nr:DnaD domain protein [Paenibacillus sp. LHD-117]MDQ6418184.1 DnaD domain protein [Paenibacillus sp. LHD-117]